LSHSRRLIFAYSVPPTRYRPDIPHWLENVVLRAGARKPEERFETAEEMLFALERADSRPLAAPQRRPLLHQATARWRAAALILLIVNLLLLYLLLLR
jgi:protein phosphatase